MRARERLGHLALLRAHRRLGAQCGAASCSVCVFQGSARGAGTLARSEDASARGYGLWTAREGVHWTPQKWGLLFSTPAVMCGAASRYGC